MRVVAKIDLSAIEENVRFLKKLSGVNLLAVVKADAYGHGLVPAAKAAIKGGADWLGVAVLEEALSLRKAGITVPILSWLLPPGSDFKTAIEYKIDLGVGSLKILEEIASIGQAVDSSMGLPRIHLEVDTGLSRGGFLEEWPELLKTDLSGVEVVGIFSHFARANTPRHPQNLEQRLSFENYVRDIQSIGLNPIRHLAASSATFADPLSKFDMVRCGLAIYGLSPSPMEIGGAEQLGLKRAMQVEAKLAMVKSVPAGTSVGYEATEVTQSRTKLGLISMGYADGIPRLAQEAGVTVNGNIAPIIGRISMDQFMVNLGLESSAQAGDWVTVIGDAFQPEAWGKASQSTAYEIISRIGARVPRVYLS